VNREINVFEVGSLVKYRPYPPRPWDEYPLGIIIEEKESGWVILHISGKYNGHRDLFEPISLYDDFGWVPADKKCNESR